MAWRRFLYIYETDIVESGLKFNLDDIKVETFTDGRALNVTLKIQSVALTGKQTTFIKGLELQTDPSHTTILLTARTKEENIFNGRKLSIEALDNMVSILGNIYHPSIFDKQLYSGWDTSDPALIIGETFIYSSDTIYDISPKLVVDAYQNLGVNYQKFTKMAKLYALATSIQISEDKFVKLWTALEIFPLETSPGVPLELSRLYELLYSVTGISKNQFFKRLKIYSEIYDKYRSEIVHTGSIGFTEIDLMNTTAKLEAIVRVVMRYMLGLKYENELDQFL